jgi:hypothetical protein
MVTVDLDDADRAVLRALLKQAIAADPFPTSASSKLLRGILAKLQSGPARAKGSAAPKCPTAVEREVPKDAPDR